MSGPPITPGPSATAGLAQATPAGGAGETSPQGTYLTDGVFLYRVVKALGGRGEEAVQLEDCYSLDTVRVELTELRRRDLRVVAAASA